MSFSKYEIANRRRSSSPQLSTCTNLAFASLVKYLLNSHILGILEGISQITNEGMVQMLQHSSFSNDVSYTFRPHNYDRLTYAGKLFGGLRAGFDELSSFRIYLRANVNLVYLCSTIRTLPKAPFPTTRPRVKWFRPTGIHRQHVAFINMTIIRDLKGR